MTSPVSSPVIEARGVAKTYGAGAQETVALHPVEFNAPIGCAGVPIYPGDILVGDAEGVVAIPSHLADEVAENRCGAQAPQARLGKGHAAHMVGRFARHSSAVMAKMSWSSHTPAICR